MNEIASPKFVARGRALLFAAAVLWSASGLFLKSPPLASLPESSRGPVLACYRALFATLVLLPFVRPRVVRFRPMLVPMVLSFAAMNVLFVTAMTRTTAAAAIFLQYTSTAWAFLFGYLLLKERIDRANLLALFCALAGIVCIVAADFNSRFFTGNLIALGSGLSYAGVIVSLRYLRDEDSVWLVMLSHAVAGLVLLPWVATFGLSLQPTQWALVGLMGVVQMGLPYVLFARGVRYLRAQEASLLTLIEPILNPLWVWIFWREPVAAATLLGGSLILGGLALRFVFVRPMRPITDTGGGTATPVDAPPC